jgi:hypothetical protein
MITKEFSKMSIVTILAAIALISTFVWENSMAQPGAIPREPIIEGQVERYQLFQARHKVCGIDKRGEFISYEETTLFKIDTQTGDVWYYFAYMDSKKAELTKKWMPIDNGPRPQDIFRELEEKEESTKKLLEQMER